MAAAVIIDKRALEQRLDFLSLCARKYPEKGIDHYNKLAVLRGWGVSRVLPEKPAVEIELFGTRLILDGQLHIAAAPRAALGSAA